MPIGARSARTVDLLDVRRFRIDESVGRAWLYDPPQFARFDGPLQSTCAPNASGACTRRTPRKCSKARTWSSRRPTAPGAPCTPGISKTVPDCMVSRAKVQPGSCEPLGHRFRRRPRNHGAGTGASVACDRGAPRRAQAVACREVVDGRCVDTASSTTTSPIGSSGTGLCPSTSPLTISVPQPAAPRADAGTPRRPNNHRWLFLLRPCQPLRLVGFPSAPKSLVFSDRTGVSLTSEFPWPIPTTAHENGPVPGCQACDRCTGVISRVYMLPDDRTCMCNRHSARKSSDRSHERCTGFASRGWRDARSGR